MNEFVLSAFADEIAPDLATQINVLKEHKIGFLELRGIDGIGVADFTAEYAEQVKLELDRNHLRVSAIGSPIGKIGIRDDFDQEMTRFLHILSLAEILGTRFIRIFSYYIPAGEDPSAYREEVLARIGRLVELVQDTPFVLLHENEKDIYGDTAERCLDILDHFRSSRLLATFDPANFIQCHVETYPHAYTLLKPYIRYVHIKDAELLTGNCVPTGYGDGRIPEILRDLKESGYSGFLSIEPHLGIFAGYENLELNPSVSELPLGGPRSFGIATAALIKAADSIGGLYR